MEEEGLVVDVGGERCVGCGESDGGGNERFVSGAYCGEGLMGWVKSYREMPFSTWDCGPRSRSERRPRLKMSSIGGGGNRPAMCEIVTRRAVRAGVKRKSSSTGPLVSEVFDRSFRGVGVNEGICMPLSRISP